MAFYSVMEWPPCTHLWLVPDLLCMFMCLLYTLYICTRAIIGIVFVFVNRRFCFLFGRIFSSLQRIDALSFPQFRWLYTYTIIFGSIACWLLFFFTSGNFLMCVKLFCWSFVGSFGFDFFFHWEQLLCLSLPFLLLWICSGDWLCISRSITICFFSCNFCFYVFWAAWHHPNLRTCTRTRCFAPPSTMSFILHCLCKYI